MTIFYAGIFLAAVLVLWLIWRWRHTPPATSREILLAKAFAKLLDGERGEVLEEMRELYRQSGQDVGVGLALGVLLRRLGKNQLAIRTHRSLTSRSQLENRLSALILTELGADYLASGLLDRAKQSLEQARALYPADELMARYAEQVFCRLEAWDTAAEWIKAYGKSSGRDVRPRLALLRNQEGEALLAAKQGEGAQAAFKKATSIDPHCLPAHQNMARALLLRGKPQKAKAYLEKKWSLFEGSDWLALEIFFEIDRTQGNSQLFLDAATKKIAMDPADWRSLALLGRYHTEHGDYAAAAQHLIAALEQAPQTLILHQNFWNLMLRSGHPPEFMSQYRAAVKRDMVFSDPYHCSGCQYHSPRLLWRCPACYRHNSFRERHI